jgi:ABC-2 type transport system permease protein
MRELRLLTWLTMKQQAANPLPCFMQVSFLVVVLLIFRYLWQTAHSTGGAVAGVGGADDFVWYVLCTELVVMGPPFIHLQVQEDVKSGRFEAQLLSPTGYVAMVLAHGVGAMLVRWLVLLLCGVATVVLLTGSGPANPGGVLIAMGLSLLSAVLFLSILVSIGLSSAWLGDIVGLHFFATKLTFMLGGLLIPLTLYPEWLQTVAWCSPFAPMLNGIARLVFEIRLSELASTLALLMAWGAVLFLATWLMQRRYRLRIARSGK